MPLLPPALIAQAALPQAPLLRLPSLPDAQQKALDRVELLVFQGQLQPAIDLITKSIKSLPPSTPASTREIFASGLRDIKFLQKLLGEVLFRHSKTFDVQKIMFSMQGNYSLDWINPGQELQAEQAIDAWLTRAEKERCPRSRAILLNLKANMFRGTSNVTEATQALDKAISLWSQVAGRRGLLSSIILQCNFYLLQGEYSKALKICNAALPIAIKSGDRYGESGVYNIYAHFNTFIENYEKSIEYIKKCIELDKINNDKVSISICLNNISSNYSDMKDYKKALDYLNQSLKINQEINYKFGESTVLNNIGAVYQDLGEIEKSLDYYKRGLLVAREIGKVETEATILHNMGVDYVKLGELERALALYNEALPLRRKVRDKTGESNTLFELMELWNNPKFAKRSPQLSALYGKQCINLLQSIREDIKHVGKAELERFTKNIEGAYRKLADILIEQGRILEGQQVLDLLKQHELFDLLRRNAGELSTAGLAELNEIEAEADKQMRAQSERVLALAREEEQLRKKPVASRTNEEKKRLEELGQLLNNSQEQFQKLLDSLLALFERSASRLATRNFAPTDAEALTSALKDLREQAGKRPVAIYTLMGENKLRFIVLSDLGNPVAREFPITAVELNKKVAAFRVALQNPSLDPRPLGKQLYDILIKPIEADLNGAQAQTLLWSLDGPLRYIPLAALSPDGVHYLVETPRASTIFTPAAMNAGALTRAPRPGWRALALGVTRGFPAVENQGTTLGFPALQGVKKELVGISSLLTGSTTLLDENFTKARFEEALADGAGKFGVVHIASHFHFQPTGDETRSFLLTGDGKPFTLAQLKSLRSNIFSGVDLLALSACATALGSERTSGTGAEVEGFGALAQRKGAGAVLASLWSVSDTSTTALMRAFYTIHQKDPALGKAECLRRAQLGLLTGTFPIDASQLARGTVAATGATVPTSIPRFTAPPKAPAAHPFYWAPFILIGNTR